MNIITLFAPLLNGIYSNFIILIIIIYSFASSIFMYEIFLSFIKIYVKVHLGKCLVSIVMKENQIGTLCIISRVYNISAKNVSRHKSFHGFFCRLAVCNHVLGAKSIPGIYH